jgi:hypothetical protein
MVRPLTGVIVLEVDGIDPFAPPATRGGFASTENGVRPAPAPRLALTPLSVPIRPRPVGAATADVLERLGLRAHSSRPTDASEEHHGS